MKFRFNPHVNNNYRLTHEHHTVVHLRASSSLLKKVGREGGGGDVCKRGGVNVCYLPVRNLMRGFFICICEFSRLRYFHASPAGSSLQPREIEPSFCVYHSLHFAKSLGMS